MNRRHLAKLCLLAGIAPAFTFQADAKPLKEKAGSPKKGLAISGKHKNFERILKSLNCAWFYDWSGEKPEKSPKDVEYIPMIWKYRGDPKAVEKVAADAKKDDVEVLLGFNEPDRTGPSYMNVSEAIDAWPILEKTGLRLGSPACVNSDKDWMKEFMDEANKRKLRIDFICTHMHMGDDPDFFLKRLEQIHNLYKKPIWITEFVVADWKASAEVPNRFEPDDVLKFMKTVLPELDKLRYIERYAWFPADISSRALGSSALWDDRGKLTPLGELYASH